jgi:DNA polymerase-3 subunit delta'
MLNAREKVKSAPFVHMAETWDILGHTWAVEMLRHHVADGTARHAYLLTGPTGVGRRTLALRFAQALNCTQPAEAGIPCGACDDCQRIASGRHPDVTFVHAEAVRGTLKVDQVREARRVLALKPYQGKHRVAIFLRFEEANDAAANALLKTLEEAPAHAVLILTAESPESLLPTIVSRCEVLRLQPLPVEVIEAMLKESGATDDQARLISHVSGGCPGPALHMLAHPEVLELRDEKLSELMTLLGGTRAQKFAYAAKLSKDKAGMRSVLLLWLSFWRDVLWRASGAATPISSIDRESQIDSLSRALSLEQARCVVSDLDSALRHLETNVNARLLAEVVLLDLPAGSAVESAR